MADEAATTAGEAAAQRTDDGDGGEQRQQRARRGKRRDGGAKWSMLPPGTLVAGRWRTVGKIGAGGFGEIHRAVDTKEGEAERAVALKASPRADQRHSLRMALEAHLLINVLGNGSVKHLPPVFGSGSSPHYNWYTMPLYSENLSDVRKAMGPPRAAFGLATAVRLCEQLVEAVQALHRHGYLHRDVKPSNLAMGITVSTRHTLYLLDFGLVRRHLRYEAATGRASGPPRKARRTAGFRGTLRYASLRLHNREEQCRACDMTAVFFTLVEMVAGSLPWRNVRDGSAVARMKRTADYTAALGGGEPLPAPLVAAMWTDVRSLAYADEPDYAAALAALDNAFRAAAPLGRAQPFDWEVTGAGGHAREAAA